ncbi:MAG: PQQ-binding-like beta-propeller repeat protein, partial [Anaerolineae bacterium]|nr:PQQ-binding-like beta-propeller repeat protein [Anaerolineae bacterium]
NAQFFSSPLLMESGSQPTLLFPTYSNRMFEVTVDSAQVVDPSGVPLQSGVLAEVAASDNLLFVPYRDGDVVALDRETYDEVWRLDTKEGVWSSPLLQDGVVYATSIDHFLYAVDAESGDPVWDAPVDLEGGAASTPLYNDGYLYVGSYSHKMYKVDAASGEITAQYEGNNWVWSTPVLLDGILYYTDLSGYVCALNASDLTEVWSERPAEKGIRPAPVVTADYVVVASRDGKVYWLDRETGTLIFDRELEGRPEILSDILLIEANPDAGIDDALIIVGSADPARLVGAFVLENRSPLWVYGR